MKEKINILFYRHGKTENLADLQLTSGCKLEKYIPTFSDVIKKKTKFSDFIWRIITFNNYVLFIVKDSDNITIHSSAKIGRCYKFNFLGKNSYEIGPCFTSKEWRGKGIYPYVLMQIISDCPDFDYYMFIDETNLSSIRGVEKVGFKAIGKIKRLKFGIWKKL